MNVLVTGGAGFIGSHLVDRLVADGHRVTVLDNCSTGSEENLAHLREHPSLRFVRGSVLNDDLVADLTRGMELVYHLAAAVGVRYVVDDPLWTIVTNTRGTENVLRRSAEAGSRVVFASTSEVYGASEDLPFREDAQRVLGPTWIPRWSYSTSKALDEHMCYAFADRGLDMSILRYFNIYGPRMDPVGYGSVIAKFLTQALAGHRLTVHGDGEQSRCFTSVSEAVEATVRAGTKEAAVGQVFNVGSDAEVTINELARAVLDVTGAASEITHVPYEDAYGRDFYDTRRRVPDVTKAADVLAWCAEIGLLEGLRRVAETWEVAR